MKNSAPGAAHPDFPTMPKTDPPPDWLLDYARMHAIRFVPHRLKGRGHDLRTRRDKACPFQAMLPLERITQRSPLGEFDRGRYIAQKHLEMLDTLLAACGYDRERQKIVSPQAAKLAQVWLRLNPSEPLPPSLREANKLRTERAIARLEAGEMRAVAEATRS